MIGKLKKIKEGKYPRDVRVAINQLIDLANRPMTVVFSNDATAPTVDVGENQIIITIPTSQC